MEHQVRLSALRAALLQDEEQLRALLEAEELNEAAISLQTAKIATTRLNLENENSDMTLGMRRVMTAVQWRTLEKIKQGQSPFLVPRTSPRPLDDKSGASVAFLGTVYDLEAHPEIEPPIYLSNPRPAYTPEAKAAKVEGVMIMQAVILSDGNVGNVKVLRAASAMVSTSQL